MKDGSEAAPPFAAGSGTSTVTINAAYLDQVSRALLAHERGLDLADALHHAASGRATALATFDRALASRAAAIGLVPVVRDP